MTRFRFAPSPNGRLHLGHAYSALLNERLARALGGALLLRLEDIDITRCTPALAQACIEDLAWLGLRFQGETRVQSEHFAEYAAALARLREQGLLYPCFCTRRAISKAARATDPDGAPLYPGSCRRLPRAEAATRMARGEPHGWRLAMERALEAAPGPYAYRCFAPGEPDWEVEADPAAWGDTILARKEIPTSYHLSVVWDDALQAITHVVRGTDLEKATGLHVLLQRLLDLPTPLYHHHALITLDGEKLAKSKNSETLADLRARGVTPRQVRAMVGLG